MSLATAGASALILLMLVGNLLRLALVIRQLGERGPRSIWRGRNARPGVALLWDIAYWANGSGHDPA